MATYHDIHRHPKYVERCLVAIRIIKQAAPSLRIGQIITNAIGSGDLFNCEDDVLALRLEEYIKRIVPK